ncbi:MAG: matrixin family metalloprotease [Vicinamibacterales bacterium]
MRAVVLTLALSALALLPTAAIAADPPPAVGNFPPATVAATLAVADNAVSPNPCAGREKIVPVSPQEAQYAYAMNPTVLGFAQIGGDYRGDCIVHLIPDNLASSTAALLCSVIAHEIGHLTGRYHSDDPNDLMYPMVPVIAPCAAAFPAPVTAPRPPVTTAAPPAPPAPAPVVTAPADDTLASDFREPFAATASLVDAWSLGAHRVRLLLDNHDDGKLIVTYYRRGMILGGHARKLTPWDLHGRVARVTVPLTNSGFVQVRSPHEWQIATLQIKQPGTRQGIITGVLRSRLRAPDPPSCEFTLCA